jgi:predicted enzyme related to lactoylglutathione lyase
MTDASTLAQQATPTFAPGTPIWVDHTSKDVQGSAKFYGQLFGWQAQDLGEEAGHYTMFTQDGKQVAATTPPMSPESPSVWTTYISSSNIADTAKKVDASGGKTLVAPMQVMDQGSMGVFMDPTGAVFAVWQPAAMTGAGLVNKPVSLSWNELASRDMKTEKDFYSKVFGWGIKANPMPDGTEYVEWQINGKSVGGGMQMGSMYPPEVLSHWLVYFAVGNTDATVKRAQELGGKVMSQAMDIPQGRMAVLSDPQGATFAVIQLNPQ